MARRTQAPDRPSRVTVPAHAHPLARLVFAEMNRQRITYESMTFDAGIQDSTLKAWRVSKTPGLTTIEAALGVVGWSLVPVPRHDRLPLELQAELDRLAGDFPEHMPLLPSLLATVCKAPLMPAMRAAAVDNVIPLPVRRKRLRAPHPEQAVLFEERVA